MTEPITIPADETMGECMEDGCASGVRFRGFCGPHYDYRRRRMNGAGLLPKQKPYGQRLQRFWAKVQLHANDYGCWEWTGAKSERGYGKFQLGRPNRKTVLAHRFSCEQFGIDIPKHLVPDHLCRNTSCVRPGHIEVVTQAENVRRGYEAQRARSKNNR